MQFDLSQIFSNALTSEPPIEAPDWIKQEGVCPFLRGDELWFGNRKIIVKGPPPLGTPFRHTHVHILKEDSGPIGTPVQVRPYITEWGEAVAFQNEYGDILCHVLKRHVDLIELMATGFSIVYFHYPEIEEGVRQSMAVFERGYEANDQSEYEALEHPNALRPFAFISPVIANFNYFMMREEIEAQVPVFTDPHILSEEVE